MKIAVKDLRPNPFRDLTRYPVNPDKVAALVASIKDTEFWDNLLARKDTDGGYELAYGVHRLQALKKAGVEEVDIPVRKLSDTVMAKIMAHENQEEWAHSAIVAQETIRAIVLGFADGRIEMPKASSNNARYAPSFASGGSTSGRPEVAYSAASLSKLLGGDKAGWADSKIEAILNTLAAVEHALVEQEDLVGLSVHQADQVARQAKRVVKETGNEQLAKVIGKRLAGGMRTATGRPPGVGGKKKNQHQAVTYHGAKRAADEMMAGHRRKTTAPKMPNIEAFAEKIVADLAELPTEKMQQKLDALIQYRDELHSKTRQRLVGALLGLAKRVERFAEKVGG